MEGDVFMAYQFVDVNEPASEHGMSIKTIFNGAILDDELTDENGSFTTLTVSGRRNTENKIATLGVTGMHGTHEEQDARLRPRNPQVKFRIKDKTNEGFAKRLTRLNSLLKGAKEVLEFADEDVIYYATLEELDIPEEESNDLIGTITFFCSDPFKYGPEIESELTADDSIVINKGTFETEPIFELTAKKSTTFASIQNQLDEYIMLGRPEEVDKPVVDREELILHDNMNSVSGWSISDRVDNGYVAGEIISKNGAFIPDTFGVAIRPYEWQGPSLTRPIGAQLLDFKMRVEVELINTGKNTGMIEFYLNDVSGNTVMKIGIEDIYPKMQELQGKFQMNPQSADTRHSYRKAKTPSAWNNFKGVLQIFRSNGRVRPYFALVDSRGRHNWVSSAYVIDDVVNTPVSQIQVAMRIWPSSAKAVMKIKDIKFWRYNYTPLQEHEVEMINDNMESTVNWTNADYYDNGIKQHVAPTGTIKSDGNSFVVNSMGKAGLSNVWYGPSMKRYVGASLEDFRLKVELEIKNVGANKTGMIEIYMLDKDDNPVMKIGIEDIWRELGQIQGKFSMSSQTDWRSDHYVIADTPSAWNNFSGIVQIFRSKGKVRPFFGLVRADGSLNWVSSEFYMMDNFYTPVTQVQVAFRGLPNTTIAPMKVKNLIVSKYNNDEDDIGLVAKIGDVITFDHKRQEILINGEARDELKDFGSSYFTLKEGNNFLSVIPSDTFDVTIRYREKFI